MSKTVQLPSGGGVEVPDGANVQVRTSADGTEYIEYAGGGSVSFRRPLPPKQRSAGDAGPTASDAKSFADSIVTSVKNFVQRAIDGERKRISDLEARVRALEERP
jgi:hypothetical protein